MVKVGAVLMFRTWGERTTRYAVTPMEGEYLLIVSNRIRKESYKHNEAVNKKIKNNTRSLIFNR